MKQLEVEFQGQTVRVWAENIRGQIWFHREGQTRVIELNKGRQRSGQKAGGGSGEIQAPMPGKIIKVLVKVQAPVEVGTPLIVMEAMKMEYSLKSDVNGIVAEIRCREGEQVALGQFLARVEGSKDEK